MVDCITTVKSGEPIKNNNSSVLWSYSIVSKGTGFNSVAATADVDAKYTDRFDDPNYYPGKG
jgi:hypothetical protein